MCLAPVPATGPASAAPVPIPGPGPGAGRRLHRDGAASESHRDTVSDGHRGRRPGDGLGRVTVRPGPAGSAASARTRDSAARIRLGAEASAGLVTQ
jgi:hypothetical protein